MTIFISHATEDKKIAEQWQSLIRGLTANLVEIWYSSDLSTAGGMPGGTDWRKALIERLAASRVILALLTPRSVARPWIYWECGAAAGVNAERPVFPIFYGMRPEDVPNPLNGYQMYDGCNQSHVRRVCEQMLRIDNPHAQIADTTFNTLYRAYIKQVTRCITESNVLEQPVETVDLHKRYINDFDWLNDEQEMFATASEDETLRIAALHATAPVSSLKAKAAVKCVISVPDRSALIYGTAKGDVSLWRFESTPEEDKVLFKHPLVRVLGYSARHALVASGGYDKYLRVHKLDRDSFAIQEVMQTERSDVVRSLAWASQDSTLAFASGAEVNLVSLAGESGLTSDPSRLLGHTGIVLSICWNKGDTLVASGDEDGTLIVWNPVSRRHTVRLDRSPTLAAVRSLSFHPKFPHVLAVGGKSGVLEIIKVTETGSPRILTLGQFGTFINAIRWHHTGSPILFACGGAIKSIAIELPSDYHEPA